VFDDQNVPPAESLFLMLEGVEEQLGQGVAGLDLGRDAERDDLDFRSRARTKFLSPLRGWLGPRR
jgi:hypothetical protein